MASTDAARPSSVGRSAVPVERQHHSFWAALRFVSWAHGLRSTAETQTAVVDSAPFVAAAYAYACVAAALAVAAAPAASAAAAPASTAVAAAAHSLPDPGHRSGNTPVVDAGVQAVEMTLGWYYVISKVRGFPDDGVSP